MFWIHGGGFGIHSSSNYGDSSVARNLCVKDVVYVSINYRLGPLGFFTTGDEHCRGREGVVIPSAKNFQEIWACGIKRWLFNGFVII